MRSNESQVRTIAHGRAAHRRRAHRPVQLAARAPRGRRAGAAHRGHRPRALDAGERRADPRRAALAGSSTGTRGRSCRPSAPSATARRFGALLDAGHAYRSNATAEDVKAYKLAHGADRGFRGEPEAEGGGAPARARRGRDGRPRRHPRRHALRARPSRRSRDRPRRRVGALQLRGRDRRSRRGHHARGPRRGSPLEHPQAAARAGGRQAVGLDRSGPPDDRAGQQTPLPVYAHLPLLHGPDGKKLSKRHGAASVRELREAGYLPEAVRNYLALLGWGAGDDETVLSTEELVERFDARSASVATRHASTRSSCAG